MLKFIISVWMENFHLICIQTVFPRWFGQPFAIIIIITIVIIITINLIVCWCYWIQIYFTTCIRVDQKHTNTTPCQHISSWILRNILIISYVSLWNRIYPLTTKWNLRGSMLSLKKNQIEIVIHSKMYIIYYYITLSREKKTSLCIQRICVV